MSGQDVNPFADPADINPFSESSPSAPTSKSENDFSNDFNPFAAQQNEHTPVSAATPSILPQSPPMSPKSPNISSSPELIEPVADNKPFNQRQSSLKKYGTTDDSLNNRQEELERKAAELDRREKELRNMAIEGHIKNFPPLPKWCCIRPCFYHDISLEVPSEHQRTCRILFFVWLTYVVTITFNMISALAGLSVGATDGAILFGISLLYFVLFPLMSFVCWYRPAYKALGKNSSFNYMIFFFVFVCQTAFMFLYALGISSLGTCGWINGANLANSKTGNTGVAAMYFVCGSLFTALTINNIFLIRRVHRIFRSSGATIQKAQQEFANDIASSQTVQNAATSANGN